MRNQKYTQSAMTERINGPLQNVLCDPTLVPRVDLTFDPRYKSKQETALINQ